jgi:hypothetical protein
MECVSFFFSSSLSLYFPFQASIQRLPVPLEGKRETIDGWIPGEKREKKRKKRYYPNDRADIIFY